MFSFPGLTNNGTMPLNLSGGHAGPSNALSDVNADFRIGGIQMGGNTLPVWLLVIIAAAVLWFVFKGGK